MNVLFCLNQTGSFDPRDWENAWVWVPSGYGRVLSGRMKQGDRWLNRIVFSRRQGCPKGETSNYGPLWRHWQGAAGADHSLYLLASVYSCVIRPGVPSEKPCERCRTQPRFKGERFCNPCGALILEEGRR